MSLTLLDNTLELRAKEISFPSFEKKAIYDAHGKVISNFSAITNVENEAVSAVMSNKYTIVNHNEAFDVMDKAVHNMFPMAKADVSFRSEGGAMKIIYDLPEKYNVEVGQGDPLRTRLVGYNSVDGSKCLSFHVDFFRLVCQNGMVGFSREFSFTHKHSRNVKENVYEFGLGDQLEKAWKIVAENAQMLKNNAVDYDKGMEAIKAMVDRKLFPKKMQTWIEDEWRRATVSANSISAENGGNLWTLYNSVTSAITHSINTKGEGLSDQQKELYGQKLNSVILKLAA